MAVQPGTKLGPYEIVAHIGAGGMGHVWKARDPRLNRTVAIKIVEGRFSERFEREAKAIAALNHPNICALYDVGPNYLVMEYIEGHALKGPLSAPEALKLAIPLADALAYAHQRGVTHRDLKPANILVAKAGPKILDFGLAKITSSLPEDATATAPVTKDGTILGTLYYMSPEQLGGKDSDHRSDVWAFGAVLYEMLTGRRAFTGDSHASVIAAIMSGPAPPVPSAPPLDRLIRGCLEKDPDQRWQAMRDLWRQLQFLAAPEPGEKPKRAWYPWLAVALCVAGAVAAYMTLARARVATSAPSAMFAISDPDNGRIVIDSRGSLALAPDGTQLVFTAIDRGTGKRLLYLRPLQSLTAKPLAGTEGGFLPFWAPDGRRLGFFAAGRLKTLDVPSLRVETLADAHAPQGASWSTRDEILYTPKYGGPLYRIPARGGTPQPATRQEPGETMHTWPYFLPDGRHFLYQAPGRELTILIGDLDSDQRTKLQKGTIVQTIQAASVAFAPTANGGYLIYSEQERLVAQRVNLSPFSVAGNPVTILRRNNSVVTGAMPALFSVSANGVLAWGERLANREDLQWVDRSGHVLDKSHFFGGHFAVSPDGRRLAYNLRTDSNMDVWIADLVRGTSIRLTSDAGEDWTPSWSPDGKTIAFTSDRGSPGVNGIFLKPADASAPERPLLRLKENIHHLDWSPDGRWLAFEKVDTNTNYDIWIMPMTQEAKPQPYVASQFLEMEPSFSPDSNWIAYASNEAGEYDIYVQSFPAGRGRHRVSSAGGVNPLWRGDGRELFFLSGNGEIMAAAVRARGGSIEIGTPRALFPTILFGGESRSHFSVTPDGQRFLVPAPGNDATLNPVYVLLQWEALLGR